MKRVYLYILIGVIAAFFAVILALPGAALLNQDREMRQLLEEHDKALEADIEAQRRETEQLVVQFRQKMRRLDEMIERARLSADLAETLKEPFNPQPDKAQIEKMARLSVEEIVRRLRDAMETGRRKREYELLGALRTKGQDAVSYLTSALSARRADPDRHCHLSMLSSLRDPETLPFFQELLKNETDELSRRIAATALMRLPDESSVGPLIEALRTSADWGVKTNICAALGVIEDPRAIEPLKETFWGERKPLLRCYALAALARIGDPGTAAFFSGIASRSKDEDHRLIALNGLKKIGTPEALAALKDIASHQTNAIGEEARKALEELSRKESDPRGKEHGGDEKR